MRKRTLQKAVVLFVCFMFLGLSSPGLMAATTESETFNPTLILKVPVQFLVSLFPFLLDLLMNDDPVQTQPTSTGPAWTIEATGTIKAIRLSGGD